MLLNSASIGISVSLIVSVILWRRGWYRYIPLIFAATIGTIILNYGSLGEIADLLSWLQLLGAIASTVASALLWEKTRKILRYLPVIYFMLMFTGTNISIAMNGGCATEYPLGLMFAVVLGAVFVLIIYIWKWAKRYLQQREWVKRYLQRRVKSKQPDESLVDAGPDTNLV